MAGSSKLFTFNRKYSHIVGIYPPQSNQSAALINSRNWIFIISFLLWTLPSAVFLVNEAKSMLEFGLSFYATLNIFSMFIYLATIGQMEYTWQFIENCKRFIEKREDSISTTFAYRLLVEKIEQFCKFVGIGLINSLLFGTLPLLLVSLINYYILDLGEESFLLLYPVKWPFNWRTPLGYFVAWFAQSAGSVAAALTGCIVLNFILGSCWLFMFMVEDIKKDVVAFNIDVKMNENRAEWIKCFCDIIQLHSDAKECVDGFNASVKYSLFSIIGFIMLSVSSLLLILQFQLLDENAKLFETLLVLVIALWVFGLWFLICELGERMTGHFDMFYKELERYDWHKLPIEMQRIYLIFLSDTQQSTNITCYGNILCVRETFKEKTKIGWSFFMTLRRIGI